MEISELYEREEKFSELLCRIMEKQELHYAVNEIALFFERSIIVTDLSFRLVDYSSAVPITDQIWLNNIDRGFCSYEFITAVDKLMPKSLADKPQAFPVECRLSTEKRICCPLVYQGQHIGYIAIIDNSKGILEYHYKYLPRVMPVIVQLLMSIPNFHSMFVDLVGDIFVNLLYGENAELAQQRISAARLRLPKKMRCCVFLLKSESAHERRYFQDRVSEIYRDGLIFTYEKTVVAIISAESSALLHTTALDLSEHAAHIGVSAEFTDIKDLPRSYQSALHVCKISDALGDEQKICEYSRYHFYELLLSCGDKELLLRNLNPALEQLQSYDLAKKSSLLKTLSVYLKHGQNINDTAQELFLHRNSLKLRLDKIEEITNLNLRDPETVFDLCCSFKINDVIKAYSL